MSQTVSDTVLTSVATTLSPRPQAPTLVRPASGWLVALASGHNNFNLWGPGVCTGQVLIGVGIPPADLETGYADITVAAVAHCPNCVSFERNVSVVVASNPKMADILSQWAAVKHTD